MASDTKTKIFLYAGFFILFLFILIQIVQFFRVSIAQLDNGRNDMGCNSIELKLIGESYINKNLNFQLSHSKGFSNISQLTIETDTGENRIVDIDPALAQNQYKNIIIENISINKDYSIYVQSCKNGKLQKI